MKETFVKTIQGHQLEFNKQVFPIGYKVSQRNVDAKNPLIVLKDDRGMWNVNDSEQLPGWFNEISTDVHFAIVENETRDKNMTINAYAQYTDLF